MKGQELLDELAKRHQRLNGLGHITDSALAKTLGVTPPALVNYRKGKLTCRQFVNLLESYSKARIDELIVATVVPVVEFFEIEYHDTGSRYLVFSDRAESGGKHPYLEGLKQRLDGKRGIYVFHDSRGRAIYAGKAQKLTLWDELNNAFNRDRREVQSIKRVSHPQKRVKYKGPEEKKRQIVRQNVPLHDIAAYFSAYEVPDRLIGKFEALIVRAFANDLLNVRMEKF
ncbi:hypothetical protein [Lysobacter sp. Root690]|uniref:hypothetical protein n=1 Tax=Lysobacter sp. Root690 TaxID=1736588 RepID=UPI000A40BDE6|nr:hypothetical protein [Lysobacter sp. Root690]